MRALSASMLLLAVVTSLLLTFLYLLRFRRRNPASHPSGLSEKTRYRDVETPGSQSARGLSPSLPTSVTAGDQDTIGRDQWVLRMTRHVFSERHNGRHNVLVINDDLQYHFLPVDVVEEFRVVYHDKTHSVPYRIVVFQQGDLLNLGDGGDINWDWMGNFKRLNNSQLSFSPCKTGQDYQQDPWMAVAKSE